VPAEWLKAVSGFKAVRGRGERGLYIVAKLITAAEFYVLFVLRHLYVSTYH